MATVASHRIRQLARPTLWVFGACVLLSGVACSRFRPESAIPSDTVQQQDPTPEAVSLGVIQTVHAQGVIQAIHADIAEIEPLYSALQGFSRTASVADHQLHFERKVRKISKRYPQGLLDRRDGCLIQVWIHKRIEGGQHAISMPSKNLHPLRMMNAGSRQFENLALDVDVIINVKSDELLERLHAIVAKDLEPLQKMDRGGVPK